MRVYRKKMRDIVPGDVVAGNYRGWWRITSVDIDHHGVVVAHGINTADGSKGWVQGPGDVYRDLAA